MALVMSSGMHFGGLLGGGGLAVVAAGCAYLQAQQPNAAWPLPMGATAGMERPSQPSDAGTETASAPDTASSAPAVPSAKPAALPPTSLAGEPDIIASSAPPTFTEPAAIQPARQPQGEVAADGATQPATFIVKFKENDAVDEVIANWRRDRPAARAAFAGWAEGDPLFSNMQVVGCSYSGELILETEVPAGPAAARTGVARLIGEIRAHDAVAYADPDFIAQPGQGENR